ncbi:LytR/AlgR family response regulator transcription factor [Zavarzinia compransoris]|uniref:DNA-binding response regulator n=1 Tax=Zavarzinia compransoris TaxID=1264899 RepID=A0A317DW38_9PROT|nr:LytTR family DNA-binding domain-containing protein [Zavarzinia compransoris]PWR18086.1 DNA-binding response regulator [Zavarzinia compransoris]TDP43438.1 LytTR family two component transcriptional regulator [Zavarzinia compransoris]
MRAILVDDEPAARRGLARLIEAAGLDLVGQAATVPEAARLIEETRPDAAFLDIEIGGATSFDLLAALARPPKVIFVTAHSDHALRAFDFQVVDFLLKPLDPARFAVAVQRLERTLKAEAAIQQHRPAARPQPRSVQVSNGRETRMVDCRRILCLEAERDYTRLYLEDEAPLLANALIGRLEEMLPKPMFRRISRSLILNTERIERIETPDRNSALVHLAGLASPIAIGRAGRSALRQFLLGPVR